MPTPEHAAARPERTPEVSRGHDTQGPRYLDPDAAVEDRVADLLARMTLREKTGQLNQRMYGWEAYRRTPDGFELTEALYAETERFAGLGALYGLLRADAWSGVDHSTGTGAGDGATLADLVQRHVMESSRLGIPALLVEEVPHGLMALDGTVLPVNLAVGATWDPELYEQAAAHAAAELRARGGHVALVSALDLARDPRWGRTEECFGEDPYLAARLTEALVRGMQGQSGCADGQFAEDKAAVVLKHFAGQGATVGGRNSAESELGPRELHEIHLPAAWPGSGREPLPSWPRTTRSTGFPARATGPCSPGCCASAGPSTGWSWPTGSPSTDWPGSPATPSRRAPSRSTRASTSASGTTASRTWKRPSSADSSRRHVLDAAVARVLRLKFRLGLFERPCAEGRLTAPSPDRGRELSTALARGAVTLLHDNGGVLPVRPAVSRIAVLGPHAATTAHQLGDYTAPQRPGTGVSLLDALRRLAPPGVDVRHARGCALTGDDLSGIPEAIAQAGVSDLAVLALGGSSARTPETDFAANGAAQGALSEMTCGEGADLAGLRLGRAQHALLDAVVATGTPTVVVLVQGRPHAVPEAAERAAALLTAWYPGPWGGDAIAEVLLGHAEPLGRLPVSVPRSAAQLPVYYNHKDTEYGAYVDASAEPLYSFGHGLSYTSFAYGPPLLSGHTVTVDVTNTGERAGRTVVQFYIRRLVTPVWPRTLELRAFRSVELVPGETRTVVIPLGADQLAQVGADLETGVLPGTMEIRVAESARAALDAVPAVLSMGD
jgi:beta-glucosidase